MTSAPTKMTHQFEKKMICRMRERERVSVKREKAKPSKQIFVYFCFYVTFVLLFLVKLAYQIFLDRYIFQVVAFAQTAVVLSF